MTAERYIISRARPRDLIAIPLIELEAARLLAAHAPATVLAETTSLHELTRAQRHGHLWVALSGDRPVGFAHVVMREPGAAHLEELDVHPAHGRRGLGTRLVTSVCRWGAATGLEQITLTTFRDVPWNMPFYAQLGFEVVPATALSAALQAVVADETRRGLDPERRVVMRKRISAYRADEEFSSRCAGYARCDPT